MPVCLNKGLKRLGGIDPFYPPRLFVKVGKQEIDMTNTNRTLAAQPIHSKYRFSRHHCSCMSVRAHGHEVGLIQASKAQLVQLIEAWLQD